DADAVFEVVGVLCDALGGGLERCDGFGERLGEFVGGIENLLDLGVGGFGVDGFEFHPEVLGEFVDRVGGGLEGIGGAGYGCDNGLHVTLDAADGVGGFEDEGVGIVQ